MKKNTIFNILLSSLEYNGRDRVIELNKKYDCPRYCIVYDDALETFHSEFEGDVEDIPYWKEPIIFEKEGRQIYQASEGRVILTRVIQGKRVGVTKAKPVGWEHNIIVEQKNYFYHKTHILGDQLVKKRASYIRGENILGTRILNIAPTGESMKTYEDMVRGWLEEKKVEKVFYMVTPIYRKKEPVPRGVRMSAIGFENGKESLQYRFDVFIFNVYPGYKINYLTGSIQRKRRLG